MSAVLLVAGAVWLLPPSGAGIALAIAGLMAYILAARSELRILELHGAVFLCTATAISGMAIYIFGALAGLLPGGPAVTVWIIASCAVTAYAVGKDKGDWWVGECSRLIAASLAVSAICALLVREVVALATLAISLEMHHIAFLRTSVISAVSLFLAFGGSRWGQGAMTRLAYVSLVFVALKLLFEDLRHGHMEFTAGSIFLFAVALIAVPGLIRKGAKLRAEAYGTTPAALGS